MRCGPKIEKNGKSCFDHQTMIRIRDLWNIRHPDVVIDANDDAEIWSEMNKRMMKVCSTEKCWIQKEFADDAALKEKLPYTFLPDAPKKWKSNPKEWLTSTDITDVMKQYEDKHDNFRFLGPSPIDYDKIDGGECVWDELCNYNTVEHLKKGIHKIGVVFNLDPHYKGGSHWISMFIDYERNFVFFFDSTGEKMPPRVKRFIKMIETQASNLNISLKKYENNVSHQRGNTECGIYCLYMITNMLEKRNTPKAFMGKRIPDDFMLKQRRKFFDLST
jgi:hypothetical protein